jgi:predicted O-methyltransferase YrrM
MKPERSISLRNNILQAVRQAMLLVGDGNLQIDDDVVRAWLTLVKASLSAVRSGEVADLHTDWNNPGNLTLLFRSLSQAFATRVWPHPAAYDLNRFANSFPAIFRTEHCVFTFDFFSSRIPQLQTVLGHFAGRPKLNFLEVGSSEGLSACWLLRNILTDPTCRLISIDLLPLDSPSRLLFRQNIGRTGAQDRVTMLVGQLPDFSPSNSIDAKFDFIYIDSSNIYTDLRLVAAWIWRSLKRGGILVFDDYLIHQDPLSQLTLWNGAGAIGIDAFLREHAGEYNILNNDYLLIIERL